jgi:NAD(P)-dependent dehydrogenase (short-subunit alcohol dehydrogenase family)
MSFLSSGVAVVTGAGSGIGRALAQRLAAGGSALAIADVDEPGLLETAQSIANKKALLTTHVVDVAEEASMRAFAEDVNSRHGRVTLLINNAGVALEGTFEEISLDDFRWVMNINFWGVVYGVKFFLPMLRREQHAHIANISSLYGLIAPAGQPAYSSSKFAVRGFTECLRHELAETPVRVSCVHPAGIRTAIARRARVGAAVTKTGLDEKVARFEKYFRTTPEEAAARILRGVERNEPRILIGSDAYKIDILQRLRPGTYWKALSRRYNELTRD